MNELTSLLSNHHTEVGWVGSEDLFAQFKIDCPEIQIRTQLKDADAGASETPLTDVSLVYFLDESRKFHQCAQHLPDHFTRKDKSRKMCPISEKS